MLKIGEKAPDFKLLDQDNKEHSLSNYLGQFVLIYFYPKDDTPGCTKEACMIRDDFHNFKKINAKVIGISADSPASHKKFAEKYNLPFTLLSDEKRAVIEKYGAKKEIGIKRMSYLLDINGFVVKIYPFVKPEMHAKEVLNDLEALT